MQNPDIDGALMPLPEALRALPQVAPELSAWPQLAAQLAAQARTSGARDRAGPRRRFFLPAALAAGIALAFVATSRLRGPAAPSGAAPATATIARPAASYSANAANTTNSTSAQMPADADAQLVALQKRSQALEHWLHETARAAAPLSGQDLAAATEIEDMIGLVDVQLGAQTRDGGLPLWRHRVDLLEDLTALRYSSYSLAASGVDAKTLRPTTWTN